ncbi:hypothetical protein GCM10027566_05120 [Arachidicoccus ginsenosidivorans]|uniref:DUF4194 domain-containing protein n=1 Tax=Arachidicoccus ginsenosidivorans TaxID=496057 RepID=A0A5B8VVA2_9BACT|nr:DUF4194 domain-containing protein [Arachidicoccus ginsenosidivorans]QEC74108.1 DUF4194 domain-containing protein [Arachidicoccus ginsenosidivorans]
MEANYSLSLISLLKGIVYNHQKEVWENLLQFEADIKNYFKDLSLEVYIDKTEGYSFLRQYEWEDEPEGAQLPKLIEKRQLSYQISLLCLILRKYMLEQDAQGGAVRVIITEPDIINRARLYLPAAEDEAKQQDKIVSAIKKVIELGFLRKIGSNEYEIHRIIKGFINAEVIESTLNALQKYATEKNE